MSDKPIGLVDGCWTGGASPTFTPEPHFLGGPGTSFCNSIYPGFSSPRMVAGGPLTNDVIKCRLKKIDLADYAVTFSPEEIKRLGQIFPRGVCDWSRPGVEQPDLAGTGSPSPTWVNTRLTSMGSITRTTGTTTTDFFALTLQTGWAARVPPQPGLRSPAWLKLEPKLTSASWSSVLDVMICRRYQPPRPTSGGVREDLAGAFLGGAWTVEETVRRYCTLVLAQNGQSPGDRAPARHRFGGR